MEDKHNVLHREIMEDQWHISNLCNSRDLSAKLCKRVHNHRMVEVGGDLWRPSNPIHTQAGPP